MPASSKSFPGKSSYPVGAPTGWSFATMSFLGLEVIPSLKLTDLGLVDVNAMEIVPLFLPEGGTK